MVTMNKKIYIFLGKKNASDAVTMNSSVNIVYLPDLNWALAHSRVLLGVYTWPAQGVFEPKTTILSGLILIF